MTTTSRTATDDLDTRRFDALAALAILAEHHDAHGAPRAAHLYRMAHDLAELAASPVIDAADQDGPSLALSSPAILRSAVDRMDEVAGELFRLGTTVESA